MKRGDEAPEEGALMICHVRGMIGASLPLYEIRIGR
jgi:hypothetical protein